MAKGAAGEAWQGDDYGGEDFPLSRALACLHRLSLSFTKLALQAAVDRQKTLKSQKRKRAVEKRAAEKDEDHFAWLEYKEGREFRQAAALKVLGTCHVSEENRAKLNAAVLCRREGEGTDVMLSENGLRVLNIVADCVSTSLEAGKSKNLSGSAILSFTMSYDIAVRGKLANKTLWSWVPAMTLKPFEVVVPFKRAVRELVSELLVARVTAGGCSSGDGGGDGNDGVGEGLDADQEARREYTQRVRGLRWATNRTHTRPLPPRARYRKHTCSSGLIFLLLM